MGLKLQITKEFISLTDQMIEVVKEKKSTCENMNFLVVKVPLVSTSVIETAEDYKKREAYKSGVARVIATPRLLNPETDADAKVGDLVIYSHEAKYVLYSPVVHWYFGLPERDESDKEAIIFITDRDIMKVIPCSSVSI